MDGIAKRLLAFLLLLVPVVPFQAWLTCVCADFLRLICPPDWRWLLFGAAASASLNIPLLLYLPGVCHPCRMKRIPLKTMLLEGLRFSFILFAVFASGLFLLLPPLMRVEGVSPVFLPFFLQRACISLCLPLLLLSIVVASNAFPNLGEKKGPQQGIPAPSPSFQIPGQSSQSIAAAGRAFPASGQDARPAAIRNFGAISLLAALSLLLLFFLVGTGKSSFRLGGPMALALIFLFWFRREILRHGSPVFFVAWGLFCPFCSASLASLAAASLLSPLYFIPAAFGAISLIFLFRKEARAWLLAPD